MGDTTMFADQGYSVLWIAHWGTSSPTLPAANWGGHGWTFWQYTSTGSVAGISGNVDLDRYNGSDLSSCLVQLHVRAAAARRAAQRPTRGRRRDAEQRSGRRLRPGHHDPGGELRLRRLHGLLERDAAAHVVRLADAAGGGRAGRPDCSARRRLRYGRQPGDGRRVERPRGIQRHGYGLTRLGTLPPVITGMLPNAAPAGGGDLTITLQGTNFAAGLSTAAWNGAPLTTTFVSPTQLSAVVPAALTATPGAFGVTVVNQAPDGGVSAPAPFTVTAPLPVLRIGASSALGRAPATGYSAKTPKVARVGSSVTWKFNLGAALAGQRVNLLVASRVGTAWGAPKYYRSAWTDPNGVVTFAWTRTTAGAINVRVQLYGSGTYATSTSPALGAYWR